MLPKAASGRTRSFGDVGSMSGLPGSGHGWAIEQRCAVLLLIKLSATHDVKHQRSGKKFHGGASHTAPNPTPRKGATAIVLRIRLRRYCGISSKNNSAISPILLRFALHRRCRSWLASESRLLCQVCLLAAVNFQVAIQPRLDSESIFAANFHYMCCRRYQGGHLSNKQFNYV